MNNNNQQPPAGEVSADAARYAALASAAEKAISLISESLESGWAHYARDAMELLEKTLSEHKPDNAPISATEARPS